MKVLNIFAMGLALVLSVNAQAETKIKVLKSIEFVDKESYGKSDGSFVSLKVNVLEVEKVEANTCNYKIFRQEECSPSIVTEERISFNSCSYEAGEKKVCRFLGAEDGYEFSVAEEKLYNYDEERSSEWLTTGALGAVVAVVGVVRWKGVRSRWIEYFKSGKSFFSGHGTAYLYGVQLPAMKSGHLTTYGTLLAGLVGGKVMFIDDAGDGEEKMHHYEPLITGGESNFDGNVVIEVEDFDAEKTINKLSRALLQ